MHALNQLRTSFNIIWHGQFIPCVCIILYLHTVYRNIRVFTLSTLCIYIYIVLTVGFDPMGYEVLEGNAKQLILTTNRPYSFSFNVTVSAQNGSAVG